MKLTPLLCVLGCGVALADTTAPELMVHLDFNVQSLANSVDGSEATIEQKKYNGTSDGTYVSMGEAGYSFKNGTRNAIVITETGLDFADSFTLALAVKKSASLEKSWANLFAVHGGEIKTGSYVRVQNTGTGDSSDYALYTAASSSASLAGDTTTGTLLKESGFSHLAMVYDVVGKSITLYEDAVSVFSLSTENLSLSGDLTFYIGGNEDQYGMNDSTPLLIDEVNIYSGALNQQAIKSLAATSLAAVPEPATATLSLLALAGLAARRRRK